jgi:uncharacterized membrane protein YkvA (DUF1232 family)
MSETSAPSLKVEFELTETDIAFFKEKLDQACEKHGDEGEILEGVAAMKKQALASNPPAFVKDRIEKLDPLVAMIKDEDWKLDGDDRKRVLDALAYFAEPHDLIPDHIPGIGYIDDAIMIDLVSAGLEPELEAYADFCAHREDLNAGEGDLPPLEDARKVMQSRMRRRRSRSRARPGAFGPGGSVTRYF